MTHIRWTVQAADDLEAIRDYVARDSEHYAALVVERIIAAVERLEAFPRSGRRVPELGREDIREVICGAYRVVYRVEDASVHILTVFRSS